MGESGQQLQAAIEVVARHFSATWEHGANAPDTTVTMDGMRIAVAVATVARRALAKPGLRFDKVARGLIARLQDALCQSVPDGTAVILTVTAPIRLPTKTAEALADKIRDCLAQRSEPVEVRDEIYGNQVRVRLVAGVARTASQVIGFVHNPDSDPDVLLDLAQSLLQQISAAEVRLRWAASVRPVS
jgi:hypothetical protein